MPVTLCFIKDKHKVMEHKIPLETYFAGLLQKVEWQIQEYEDTAADTLTLCRLCVDYLQEILGELKTFIISYPFASTEEEIHFFKELKPLLASKIIYYNTVYKIEVRFPSGSEDVQRDYLLSETDRISKSFQRNLAFYQYHRTKATYLDRQYFMRGKPDIQIIVASFYYETDPQFSTSHDFKVAKILANELLEIYLTNRLHELERREQRKRVKNGFTGKVLRWTGTKRALVELVYALDACGCLNKGTVDIKEIVAYFEYVFDIDLGGFRMFEQLHEVAPQLQPMRMGADEVERYHEYGLPRTKAYLDRLRAALDAGDFPQFADAAQKILLYGVTIEQEIFLAENAAQ